MTIIINTENIFNDIGAGYLLEGGTAPSPARGVMVQAVNESYARLKMLYGRYVRPDYSDYAADDLSISHSMNLEIDMTARRSSGKTQAFADLSHSFLVNASLAKIYAKSGKTELAELHDKLSLADAQGITNLVNTKIAPDNGEC